ncbi:MAG TPA: aspartyl protease family protein [Steroidobacteraceae bacterium]|nr:aspartyl protease family protein [Steroidobacteraceae bacterium]
MKSAPRIVLWLAASLAAAVASASANAPHALPPAAASTSPPSTAAESASASSLFASPTQPDRSGRVVAAVILDGKGPFRFLLDSAADASMISPRLVSLLSLPLIQDKVIRVEGATGVQELPWVNVSRLQVGGLVRTDVRMPLVDGAVLQGLDGILGMAGLGAGHVEVDFAHDRVWIDNSALRNTNGYLVIPATRTAGGLLQVNARIGGIPVAAVIDTGASNTLGNAALRAALLDQMSSDESPARVFGVTRQIAPGGAIRSPTIALGPIAIQHLHIVYTHVAIFKVWNLERRPAAIIGMDVLGSVSALVLDYGRSRILLLPRAAPVPTTADNRTRRASLFR